MKTLNYLFSILFMLMLSVSFSSCSDEDSDDTETSAVIGKWETTWTEGYEIDFVNPENNDEWNEAYTGNFFEFKNDGTGYDRDNDSFIWDLENGFLTMYYSDDYLQIAKILKLTASEMVLEYSEKDDISEYYTKVSFKKVN